MPPPPPPPASRLDFLVSDFVIAELVFTLADSVVVTVDTVVAGLRGNVDAGKRSDLKKIFLKEV